MIKTFDKISQKYAELKNGIDSIVPIKEGWLSENFSIISGGTRFFLKCYRSTNKDHIINSHLAKSFFYSKRIPVILPFLNRKNSTITKIDNQFCSLFPFISGFDFTNNKIPENALFSLGRMLGRIHLAGENNYPKSIAKFQPWNKTEFMKLSDEILKIIRLNKKNDFDIRAKKIIKYKQKLVLKSGIDYSKFSHLRSGLIHGDYHSSNVFFDKFGNITHVFDFEKSCIAPFALEVVRAIKYSYITDYGKTGSEAKIKSFLNGYRKKRSISDNEINNGWKMLYQQEIHDLWVEKEHYLNKNHKTDPLLHTTDFIKHLAKSAKL